MVNFGDGINELIDWFFAMLTAAVINQAMCKLIKKRKEKRDYSGGANPLINQKAEAVLSAHIFLDLPIVYSARSAAPGRRDVAPPPIFPGDADPRFQEHPQIPYHLLKKILPHPGGDKGRRAARGRKGSSGPEQVVAYLSQRKSGRSITRDASDASFARAKGGNTFAFVLRRSH